MFTLPPRPPKDYRIEDVTECLRSSDLFTPGSEPRVTQPNLAKFCVPIEYKDNEMPEKVVKPLDSSILDALVMTSKAEWVKEPGKDDFFLHEIYRKYSRPPENYDPRYRNLGKPFNRSYKYELDCVEAARLNKLIAKTERETREFEVPYQRRMKHQQQMEKPTIKLTSCKEGPPFWWKNNEDIRKFKRIVDGMMIPETVDYKDLPKTGPTTYQTAFERWTEIPNLTDFVEDDRCQRKKDMLLVGRPFKSEACNWYYQNYPPPKIKFRPQKFS